MVQSEMELIVTPRHWRYDTGEPEYIGKSRVYPSGFRDPIPKGWYCWCYTNDNYEFEQWMKANCPKADIVKRFNSGDPMWTTYINCEKEAAIFMLRWL